MKLRSKANTDSRLASRIQDYDNRFSSERGRKRPGSRNPKKGTATAKKRK